MKKKQKISAVFDATQESIQDLLDMEECLDMILEGLMDSDDVAPLVWDGMTDLRSRLDNLLFRSLLVPCVLVNIKECDEEPAEK